MEKKIPQCETGAQVVNKNHGEISPRENTRWEEGRNVLCVKKNSGGVLTVKLDYVLKGALVDIIPVLIMKNI
jgi:hypothetical protein